MISALRVFGRAIGDTWFQMIGYAACNLVVLLGSLLILPGPPLLLGLFQVATSSATYNERPEVGELLRAARANAVQAWALAAIQLAGLLVLGVSVSFYYSLGAVWSLPLAMLSFVLAWTWLGVIMYASALYVRSEGGVLLAVRNAFVLFSHYPLFSSTVLLLGLLSLGVSLVAAPLLVLVTISLLVVLSTRATTWALRKEGVLPPETKPEERPMDV